MNACNSVHLEMLQMFWVEPEVDRKGFFKSEVCYKSHESPDMGGFWYRLTGT